MKLLKPKDDTDKVIITSTILILVLFLLGMASGDTGIGANIGLGIIYLLAYFSLFGAMIAKSIKSRGQTRVVSIIFAVLLALNALSGLYLSEQSAEESSLNFEQQRQQLQNDLEFQLLAPADIEDSVD